jgi:phosphoglycolate phosphatase
VLFRRALPEDSRDEATLDRCLADFRLDYGVNWNIATKPYPGIPELLDGLAARRFHMAVLSNKPHAMTLACVRGFLPRWSFGAVYGQRDGVPKKPDPAGALEAAAVIGIQAADFLYLGDTGTDMQTAVSANMYPVGALWGFRPESELREHGARECISRPEDLLDVLQRGVRPIGDSQ